MPPRGAGIVYVVDDDEDVRDSTMVLLECAGHQVRAFASGRDFLKACDAATAQCIILDLHMPDFSGFEVLDALKARGCAIPVILFSGRSDHTTEEFAGHSGVVAVLSKPVEAKRLLHLVDGLAATGT